MKIYRIIKLKNGYYQLQSKDNSFFYKYFSKWENEFTKSEIYQYVKDYYDEHIKERNKKLNAVIDEIIISEEVK